MNELRQRIDDAMVLLGFAPRTRETYLACVAGLAKHYHCSMDRLTAEQTQSYLLHLISEKKLAYASVNQAACGCPWRCCVPISLTSLPPAANCAPAPC